MRLTVVLLAALAVMATAVSAAPVPKAPPRTLAEPAPYGPMPPPPKPGAKEPAGKAKEPPAIQIVWRKDLEAAQKEAAAYGLGVLIYFHADWCQPCRLMDSGTFTARGLAQYVVRNFIPVKVDDSKDTSPISKKYEVRVYPSILFLDAAGQPLHMVLGPRTPGDLYVILQRVQALPRLIDAAGKKPDDLETQFAAGNGFAVLNQLKRAEPYLRRAVALAPQNENGRLSQARLLLAIVPLEDGDSALAMRNIDQWLRQFKDAPEVPTAIFYQGTILFQDGKLKEAREYFERIRKEFPKHPKAYEADKAIDSIDARLKAGAPAPAPSPPAAAPVPPSPPGT